MFKITRIKFTKVIESSDLKETETDNIEEFRKGLKESLGASKVNLEYVEIPDKIEKQVIK